RSKTRNWPHPPNPSAPIRRRAPHPWRSPLRQVTRRQSAAPYAPRHTTHLRLSPLQLRADISISPPFSQRRRELFASIVGFKIEEVEASNGLIMQKEILITVVVKQR